MRLFVDACRDAIGAPFVLIGDDTANFLTDQRRRYTGIALAVVKPANTDQVAAIIKLCNDYKIAVVPQGGNTGLVLGSVPDQSGNAIVLSLTRLNKIHTIDPINNTMTVESGCILQQVQQAAADVDRLFPLSLASEGSCTLGGNLSSNAGGTAVLRYGNARDLCLGLEVVTAQGEIWNGLRGLRKDNTGYGLRDLYIGAEGTLGIITAATLKLYPQPQAQLTALVGLPSVENALALLTLAQTHCGAALTGLELMSAFCLQLVTKHFPQLPPALAQPHAQYVLLEVSDHESQEHATKVLENLLQQALEQKLIADAVIAISISQSQLLWQLRTSISPAQAAEGPNIKHDISLPISNIADFIQHTDLALQVHFPDVRMVVFGHLGDGNLHYNVAHAITSDPQTLLTQQQAINRIVHDQVHAFGGSISAEHGLGALKRDEILRYKSEIEMQLMRTIKRALDPHNLMNPGKVL